MELQPNDVLYVGRGTVHTTSTPAAGGEEQSVHLTVNLDTVAFLFSFKGAMQCGTNKLPELAPGGALLRCSCARLSALPTPAAAAAPRPPPASSDALLLRCQGGCGCSR